MSNQCVTAHFPTDLPSDVWELLGVSPPPETRNAAPVCTRNGVSGVGEGENLHGQYTDELQDLLGPAKSALDRELAVTRFADHRAVRLECEAISLRQLADTIRDTRAPAKASLPWLKLATFGNVSTAKGSLRHDANLLTVTGLEGDYDAEAVTVAQAAEMLERAGVASVVYTTPSHTAEAPRWRVLAPLSRPHDPAERDALAERLNGALGGILAKESFTRSQAFYYGAVGNGAGHTVRLVEGKPIDLLPGLPAIGRREAAQPVEVDDDDLAAFIAPDPRIDDALPFIPADDRDDWLRIGMALHHEYRGGDDGLATWCGWAKASAKYSEKDSARVWASFGKRNGSPVTVATIFEMAKAHGWEISPATIDGFEITEDGVALAFAARHLHQLRFCHSTGRWYVWSGYHWSRQETQLAFAWARDVCREMAADNPKAGALAKAAAAAAVERFARADQRLVTTADKWDADPWLLGTPGGTVDLRTGALRPADPRDQITRLTAVAPVPPDAFNPARDCPRWLAFLNEALGGDADAIRFLQQWAGYSLTGDTREEALLFVHGPGGSGKSTAINTLGDLVGDYAVNVATETLSASKYDRHSTEIARLKGARLARASETEEGRAWAQQRIKALTGGDVVTARFMRQDDFEFIPAFKLTIVGNHRPAIQNVDDAMRRRFNVLPFNHQPQATDPGLKDALRREFPGILAWAIRGCLDWQASGLTRPAVVTEATESYFLAQDSFAAWLDECCVVGAGEADTTANLWASWSLFARTAGEETGTKNKTFPDRMQQAGFTPIRDTAGIRGRGFKGLRVDDGLEELS